MQGYIKLHRQILENDLFLKEKYSKGQAWIALLLLANHKDGFITVKTGEMVEVKRGECGYSMVALADRFKWDRRTVKRFLALLESQKMVQQKIVSNHSIITILNYDKYQICTSECTTEGTTEGTSECTTEGTQTINDKNDKNNIINIREHNFKKPTIEEIKNYCIERNNSIDAQSFFDYYESIGWKRGKTKMKDWRAAIRTWEKNEKNSFNQQPKYDKENGWEL